MKLSAETEKQVVRPIILAEFDFGETVDRAWKWYWSAKLG